MSRSPDELSAYVDGLRIFTGYAGWGAGQLDAEIEQGAWFVVEALPGDPFAPKPEMLWRSVLRRQGGMMSAVAHYPQDPSLN